MESQQPKNKKILKEQSATQAIPPTPPPAFIAEAIKEVNQAKPKVLPNEDKILADGAFSDFWKILKRFIENYQSNLKKSTSELALAGQFDLNAIGMKYLLADQIVSALQKVTDYVEGKARAVAQYENEQKELALKKSELQKKREKRILERS